MMLVGFFWTFANVVLCLILLTLIGYAWPDSLPGKVASTIK